MPGLSGSEFHNEPLEFLRVIYYIYEYAAYSVNAGNADGGHEKLTICPDAGHNVRDPTFSYPVYWEWIMRRRRGTEL